MPAALAREVTDEHWLVALQTKGATHVGRCLRCDAWVLSDPEAAEGDVLDPTDELKVPERGQALRDSIVLKLIAVDRGVHSAAFTLVFVGLLVLQSHLGALQGQARALVRNAGGDVAGSGQLASRSFLTRELNKLVGLNSRTLHVLLLTAAAYAVVEGVEAVGLWRGRRWAEYLTAVATAGFLPLEIHELLKRVTVLRVIALVVNVAVLVYLVWHKRLFGLRGGEHKDEEELAAADRLPVLAGQRRLAETGDR